MVLAFHDQRWCCGESSSSGELLGDIDELHTGSSSTDNPLGAPDQVLSWIMTIIHHPCEMRCGTACCEPTGASVFDPRTSFSSRPAPSRVGSPWLTKYAMSDVPTPLAASWKSTSHLPIPIAIKMAFLPSFAVNSIPCRHAGRRKSGLRPMWARKNRSENRIRFPDRPPSARRSDRRRARQALAALGVVTDRVWHPVEQ
jgi:hypothetical protein